MLQQFRNIFSFPQHLQYYCTSFSCLRFFLFAHSTKMKFYRPGTIFQKLYRSAVFQPGFYPIPTYNSNTILVSSLHFTKSEQLQKRLFRPSILQKDQKCEYINAMSTLSCSKRLHETLRPFLAPDDVMPCDVTFRIEGTEKTKAEIFKAHKFVLGLFSQYFRDMWRLGQQRKPDEPELVIRYSNVEPHAFALMLRCMYADDQSGLTMETAMDFLSCTCFFQAEGLTRICRDFIEIGLTAANACHVFQKARGMSEERMAQLALSVICKSPEAAFASPGFFQLSPSDLKVILDRNDLNMPEPIIYQHVRRWAVNRMCHPDFKGKKNLWNAIGDLRFAIRFPIFDTELLKNGPVKDGVVTCNELEKSELSVMDARLPFVSTPRHPAPAPFYMSFQIGCDAFGKDHPDDLTSRVVIELRPEFAPQTCAFAREVFERIHSTDCRNVRLVLSNDFYIEDSHSKSLEPPEALAQETSILSPTIPGALCFGWHDNHCIPLRFTVRTEHEPVYSIWLASEKPNGGTVFGRIVHGMDLLQSAKNHAGELPCCYMLYWTTNWCQHDNFPAKLEAKYRLPVEDNEPDAPEDCEQYEEEDDEDEEEEEEADSVDCNGHAEGTKRN